MSRPAPLTGSAGSRLKVILGGTGDDYLYFFDESDGTTDWQSNDWTTGPGSLPSQLASQLNNCYAKGRYITDVAHGPNGEWYVRGKKRDGTGCHAWWGGTGATDNIKERTRSQHRVQVSFGDEDRCALVQGTNGYWLSWNVDDDLRERVDRIHENKGTIKCIRLLPDGGYFIADSEGTEWKAVGEHFGNELKSGGKDPVLDVAVAGDGSWIVIRPERFQCSTGIASELKSKLTQFYRDHKQRSQARAASIRAYDADRKREQQEKEAAIELRKLVLRVEQERLEAERREKEDKERKEAEAAERRRRAVQRAQRERAERRDTRRIGAVSNAVDALGNSIRDQQAELRHKRVELHALTETQFLWRGLRAGESYENGLFPADVTANVSLYTSIADGSRPSQFIHTSLDAETAMYYAAALNSRSLQIVVQIDHSKIPLENINDVSDSAKFKALMPSHYSTNSQTHHFACAHRVVVVSRHIPKEAILAVHKISDLRVPRNLGSCSLQQYNERLARCQDANEVEGWKIEGAKQIFMDVFKAANPDGYWGRYPPHVNAAAAAVRCVIPSARQDPGMWDDSVFDDPTQVQPHPPKKPVLEYALKKPILEYDYDDYDY